MLRCIHIMSVYYVQHLYIYIKVQKMSKMSKLYLLGTKNKQKNCEDENITFYFLWTKIKILYIYRDEKLISPFFFTKI